MKSAFSTKEFEEAFYYDGHDLGASYSAEKTAFRVWAPTASEVSLLLYERGDGDNLLERIPMKQDVCGTWHVVKSGDLDKVYYTYEVIVEGKRQEAVDPYAKAVGVNGMRGMVIDLKAAEPDGFLTDKRPEFNQFTDAVIYELHVRDFSMNESSGIENRGKFAAFTESETKNSYGQSTGLDYLKELGITHLHLMPSFDYASVDETRFAGPQFNWGYDPLNYNVPEGSYSTDPYHGEVRVKEFKQMVQSLHKNGIRIVMDVVYNHTYSTDSNFNRIVPGYYYRMEGDSYTNGSGCGNETASERAMVRKFIVDSVCYWAEEYHVDGFRFDLMGVHDIETMNAVRSALDEIDPSILIYGEGWTGGSSGLSSEKQARKAAALKFKGIGVFNDGMRDGLKGSVFNGSERGFVSGRSGMEETIKSSIVGGVSFDGIDLSKVYCASGWTGNAAQCINYVSCHDNLTLWDKLSLSCPNVTIEERKQMNKLAASIIFTSEGIPFIQAGEEILRSKPNESGYGYDGNSYQSSDAVNSIKWDDLNTNADIYAYYKGLIAFRKKHPGFRYGSIEQINKNLTFIDCQIPNVIAYQIHEQREQVDEELFIVHNANTKAVEISLPDGEWIQYIDGMTAGEEPIQIAIGKINVDKISTAAFVKQKEQEAEMAEDAEGEETVKAEEDNNQTVSATSIAAKKNECDRKKGFLITAGLAAITALAVFLGIKKKRQQHITHPYQFQMILVIP